jgi:hypothetical protein
MNTTAHQGGSRRGGKRQGFLTATFAFGLFAATAGPALADPTSSCQIQLGLDYLSGQNEVVPGDIVRARLTLGTGAIQGGTTLTIEALRYFLQCDAGASRLLPCEQDGSVVAYVGDETITTTCESVAWSTRHSASPRPNQVVFTPSAPLEIPANSPAFCELEFDVRILRHGRDSSPDVTDQVAGLGFSRRDGGCDNGLRAVAAVTAGIRVCPTCND